MTAAAGETPVPDRTACASTARACRRHLWVARRWDVLWRRIADASGEAAGGDPFAASAAELLHHAISQVTSAGSSAEQVHEAARIIDGALTRLTRRGAALQLELGHTLSALSGGHHKARLGVSSIFDFARETLGIKSNRSRRLVRVAEGMAQRPLLHEAVLRGTVDLCKADVVLPVARGEGEAAWVALARSESVDRLEDLVKAEGHLVPENYRSALVTATEGQRLRFETAMEVARFVRRAVSRPLLLEAICQEYLGEHGTPESYAETAALEAPLAGLWTALRSAGGAVPAEEAAESAGPEAEARPPPAPAPPPRPDATGASGRDGAPAPPRPGVPPRPPVPPPDPWEQQWRTDFMAHAIEVDATLASLAHTLDGAPPPPALAALGSRPSTARLLAHARRLGALYAGWSEQMGRLLFIVRGHRLFRTLGYRSFASYCRDRLLIEPRTAGYHVRLEERLQALPSLRRALREGRLTFSKAELIARHATPETVEQAIAEAEDRTLLDLQRRWDERERRRLAGEDEEGNASETGQVKVDGPESIVQLAEDAVLTARIVAWLEEGVLISPGEALARVADHFVETWREAVPKLSARERELWDRTGGACAVPGCTALWQDSHHIVFRSRGGGDALWNLHPLCRFHHNQSLHGGHLRLRGRAGERLVWELMVSLDEVVTFIETGAGRTRDLRRVRAAA